MTPCHSRNGCRLLVNELLPIGRRGLVIAGLFAAIMSTIDSTLNSATTLIVKDFVEPARTRRELAPLTPVQEARWGRLTTLALMAAAALWAPQIHHFEGLFAYLQQAFSVVVPPVVVVFLGGLFWYRATARAARLTLLGGPAGRLPPPRPGRAGPDGVDAGGVLVRLSRASTSCRNAPYNPLKVISEHIRSRCRLI